MSVQKLPVAVLYFEEPRPQGRMPSREALRVCASRWRRDISDWQRYFGDGNKRSTCWHVEEFVVELDAIAVVVTRSRSGSAISWHVHVPDSGIS
jgi:DNA-binding IclR family transcriptional regulator